MRRRERILEVDVQRQCVHGRHAEPKKTMVAEIKREHQSALVPVEAGG